MENPVLSKSRSVSSGMSNLEHTSSASSLAAVCDMPLVDMVAISNLLAKFASRSSGPKPSFSMNSSAPKLPFGP